jgi:hypothetical protein
MIVRNNKMNKPQINLDQLKDEVEKPKIDIDNFNLEELCLYLYEAHKTNYSHAIEVADKIREKMNGETN